MPSAARRPTHSTSALSAGTMCAVGGSCALHEETSRAAASARERWGLLMTTQGAEKIGRKELERLKEEDVVREARPFLFLYPPHTLN